jgi:large subunit ribosomal protein L1
MPHRGKKYTEAAKRLGERRLYSPVEAIDLVKSLAHARFDETVELAVRLGIDPRKQDQVLRGTVSLPAGTGKSVRVAVFAAGEAADAARAAGADIVGSDDLVARVDGGFMDFDVAIATPEMMGQVGRLGRKLGPRGLMPNPKTGTVTADVARAVADFKGGRVEYRADARSRGVVQVPIGKVSFSRAQLLSNLRAVVDELQRVKPAAAKGRYVRSASVSSTMGPGIDIDPARLRVTDEDLASAAEEAVGADGSGQGRPAAGRPAASMNAKT